LTEHNDNFTIAIIGGTGREGKGLAYRWAKAGHSILIGSRSIDKAKYAAEELKTLVSNSSIIGFENIDAAERADILVLTVPYQAHREILESLREKARAKIVIDVCVPLNPKQITTVQILSAGSAAMEAQEILTQDVKVAAAFHNISYDLLLKDDPIDCDVLVCCSDEKAKTIVLKLVKDAKLNGWDSGPLENSIISEGLTAILIGINKKYGSRNSGIKITGVPTVTNL